MHVFLGRRYRPGQRQMNRLQLEQTSRARAKLRSPSSRNMSLRLSLQLLVERLLSRPANYRLWRWLRDQRRNLQSHLWSQLRNQRRSQRRSQPQNQLRSQPRSQPWSQPRSQLNLLMNIPSPTLLKSLLLDLLSRRRMFLLTARAVHPATRQAHSDTQYISPVSAVPC